jgi:hypothetical protein
VWNIVLTASILPLPLSIVFAWVNTVAYSHASTAALPITTIGVRHKSASPLARNLYSGHESDVNPNVDHLNLSFQHVLES